MVVVAGVVFVLLPSQCRQDVGHALSPLPFDQGEVNDILVPGVLERFDLPQLYQAGFPRRVMLIDPLRGDRRPASGGQVAETYQPVSETYEALGQSAGWRASAQIDAEERFEQIRSALTVGAAAK